MIVFITVLGGLTLITVIIQLVKNMKIVSGNQMGVISGSGGHKGFRTLSGGRAFIIPLIQRFNVFDLTPITIEVVVDSAIAAGIVPLNVKATVSFAIAGNEEGRNHAVTRILTLSSCREELQRVAKDIIEGHLRDSLASMTPEQVMKDKDTLVAKMINVCKKDLENIGIEITTMNIADVDDHRLAGVDEPDLYIALLKRVQSANAETKARQAQAEAKAAASEEAEARRAETTVLSLKNELARLEAEVRVSLANESQRCKVGVEEARAESQARASGIRAELEAEKQKIEMLMKRFKAEVVTPAQAQAEKAILDAKADAASFEASARAELDQLSITLETLKRAGAEARRAWLIDNFDRIFTPFAKTLASYPVRHISVLSGMGNDREPISAIHPNALSSARNEVLAAALEGLTSPKEK